MAVKFRQHLRRERIPGSVGNDAINATARTKSRLPLIDPVFNLRWRKDLLAIVTASSLGCGERGSVRHRVLGGVFNSGHK